MAVITAGQKLLKQLHPHIGGLQSTILGNTLTFDVQTSEFVQIIHVQGNHWVTLSNIGCPPATVNVYDSIRNTDLTSHAKAQVSAILFCRDPHISLQFQHVQEQHGSNDCGVFALAFATSLCFGEDPSRIQYIQHLLRQHLLHCIEIQVMSNFPCQKRKRDRKIPRSQITLPIYCYCRQPEHGRMIECGCCHEWYHEGCVEVSTRVWTVEDLEWRCQACTTNN